MQQCVQQTAEAAQPPPPSALHERDDDQAPDCCGGLHLPWGGEHLPGGSDVFLVIAEELQLKGLSGAEQGPKNFDQPSRTQPKFKEKTNDKEPPQAMPKTELVNWPLQKEETLQEMSLKTAIVPVDVARTNTSYEDLDATINSMIEVTGSKLWTFKECGKTETASKRNMANHIEGKHIEGVSHPCNHCGNTFRSRNSLASHVTQHHRN